MKKSTKIIILIIVIIVVAFLGYFFIQKLNNTNSQGEKTFYVSNSKEGYDTAEAEKNIQCTGEVAENGEFAVIVKNNNNYQVNNVKVTVSFYDTSDNIVGTGSETPIVIEANKEVFFSVFDTPSSFSKYEFSVDVGEQDSNTTSHVSDIGIKANDTGDEIIIQATNNSKEDIDILQLVVVFYKDDKIVGYDADSEYDVSASKTVNYSMNYPYDKNYDNIKFDKYSVFINTAITDNY